MSLTKLNSCTIFHLTTNTANALNCIPHIQQGKEQRLLLIGEILLQNFQNIDTREDHCDEDRRARNDLHLFHGTLALFRLLQTSLYPNYYNISFRSRAIVTMSISDRYCNSPDVARAALGIIDSSQVDIEISFEGLFWISDTKSTLLQCVAERFGHSVFKPSYRPSRREIYGPLYRSTTDTLAVPATDMFDEEHYPYCGWKAFVGQLIRAGADPNAETPDGTALMIVVDGAFVFSSDKRLFSNERPSLEETLRKPGKGKIALLAWLEVLKNFGVDLEAYGRKESSILSREDVEWPGREILLYRKGAYYRRCGLYLRLIGFEFGPNPEDWKFWFSDPTDQLVGEFWDMVEHPERRTPGAWDE
jgi:hypothetical protein